jgi:hypothetical protein
MINYAISAINIWEQELACWENNHDPQAFMQDHPQAAMKFQATMAAIKIALDDQPDLQTALKLVAELENAMTELNMISE